MNNKSVNGLGDKKEANISDIVFGCGFLIGCALTFATCIGMCVYIIKFF